MKITLEHYGEVSSVEVNKNDLSLDEVIEQLIIPVLLAATWQIGSIKSCFPEHVCDHTEEGGE